MKLISNCCRVSQIVNTELVKFMWQAQKGLLTQRLAGNHSVNKYISKSLLNARSDFSG